MVEITSSTSYIIFMNSSPQVNTQITTTTINITISGSWSIHKNYPISCKEILTKISNNRFTHINITTSNLNNWDSSLLVFITEIEKIARNKNIKIEKNLPDELFKLINMAFAVSEKKDAAKIYKEKKFLEILGEKTLSIYKSTKDFISFFGEVILALGRYFKGESRMRSEDFIRCLRECSSNSLGIVSITSILFGLILAFVGAVQLLQFGAQIYVAGLVGIGMLRVLGAVMVGVVMSGRIGASYAALLGTMQVNEEIDALITLGINPVDFLVLPRLLALTIMTPLLTLYADFMGMLGGFLVGCFMLDIEPLAYLNATANMVPFKHIFIGLVYGTSFGIVIALAGCLQGINCGKSAQAVGEATTHAVVHSIVGIIIVTAIITIICNILGI